MFYIILHGNVWQARLAKNVGKYLARRGMQLQYVHTLPHGKFYEIVSRKPGGFTTHGRLFVTNSPEQKLKWVLVSMPFDEKTISSYFPCTSDVAMSVAEGIASSFADGVVSEHPDHIFVSLREEGLQ